MLKIFNGKNPIIVVLYPIIAFLFLYFSPDILSFKQNIPNYPLIYGKLLSLFGKYFLYFYIGFGILFLSVSAFFFNNILRKIKLIKLYNNIGGLIWLLLLGTFGKYFDMLQIGIATLFFLISVKIVIDSLRKTYVVFDFFNAGFALAIASFFWIHILWFYVVIIFGLFIFRNFNFREFLTSLIGVTLPWFFLISVWFFVHSDFSIISNSYNLFFVKLYPLNITSELNIISLILLVIFLFTAFQILKNFRSKESDIQDYYTFFILTSLAGISLFFFFRNYDFSFFAFLLVVFSMPVSIWFSENHRRVLAEILFDVFLLTVIFSQIHLF